MNSYILLTQKNAIINNIPPRLMWNVVDNSWQSSASGYCGETSLLSAGLLYGQYVPMYMVRQLLADYFVQLWGSDAKNASSALQTMWGKYFGNAWSANGSPQGDYPGRGNVPLHWFKARPQYYCQVLPQIWRKYEHNKEHKRVLADNAAFEPINAVLQDLRLAYEHFYGQAQNTKANFIPWMKQHVVNGHPVVLGVQDFLAGSNDPDFDHIVVVIGWGSNKPLSNPKYFPEDEIVLIDHGLVVGGQQPHGGAIPYYFRFSMKTNNSVKATGGWLADGGCPDPTNPAWNFIMDLGPYRNLTSAMKPAAKGIYTSNTYQLAKSPTQLGKKGSSGNAGFAITGLDKSLSECIPVRIDTDLYYQVPCITTKEATHGKQPKTKQIITHTITIKDLNPNTTYNLWLFTADDTTALRAIPTSDFNAYGKANGLTPVTISNESTFSYKVQHNAGKAVVARCVSASR